MAVKSQTGLIMRTKTAIAGILSIITGGPSSDGILQETGDYILSETGDYLLKE